MKKNDLAIVAVVAVVGTLIAYFALNAILGDPDKTSVTVDYVSPISGSIDGPDPEVFNSDAINPTIEVIIGE
jgi:hypothetical protein